MAADNAAYHIGQLVEHRMFGYRGVVYDIDPVFLGAEDWYQRHARSRPPKDAPWYHVLVDEATHTTYVAERNLAPDPSGARIAHPAVDELFRGFQDGRYLPQHTIN